MSLISFTFEDFPMHYCTNKYELTDELSSVLYVKQKLMWQYQAVFGCIYYIIDNRAADVNTRHVTTVIYSLIASQHQVTSLPFVLPSKETNKHIIIHHCILLMILMY